MSREIKFRIWDKIEKQFIYPDRGYKQAYVFDKNRKFYSLVVHENSFDEEYEVQQFTGIRDINMLEIYEGDVVKYKAFSKLSDDNISGTSFIVWHKNYATFGLFTKYLVLMHECFELEVIGNILANPELINKC